MNIFFLDKNPTLAAEYQCDKHVVKMILETTQMVCTAYQARHGIKKDLYKPAFPHHPMTKWVGETYGNFNWALTHLVALGIEYTLRYNKFHKCLYISEKLYMKYSEWKKWDGEFTTPPLCMPEQYKHDNFVEAYRNYYIGDKKRFAKYKNSKRTDFML